MIHAQWIWRKYAGYDLVNVFLQARKTFELSAIPKKAIINITADARYRLYVNGSHVCRGPARGFQQSWPYDTVDVAPFLCKGKNVIAVLVHNYGISIYQYVHEGYAGLLAWGRAGGIDIDTNNTWKVRLAPGYIRNNTRVSEQLGFQEHFDGRKDNDLWLLPDYDDSSWVKPSCMILGKMPWPQIEERGLPLFREQVMLPVKMVSEARGACAQDFDHAQDIVTLYTDENRAWKNTAASLLVGAEWAEITISAAGKDQYVSYCIDFGKEVVGSLRLRAEGGTGNEIIDTVVSERTSGATPYVTSPQKAGCAMAFGNRLFLCNSVTEHEQFDHWGFRYLIVTVRNTLSDIKIKMRLHWVGYPLDVKSAFVSSNTLLNDIYRMSAWTQQCCTLDAYVDCPWREQAQWWGDARVQAKNTFYLSADARVFKRGIRQIGTQMLENGLTYGHAPTMAHNCILPDFTLVWVMTHWDYYWQTGDLSLFKQMKDAVHKAFGYFAGKLGKNGLLPYDNRYWLFLDWTGIFKDGYPALYNMMYLMALRAAADLFKLCKDNKSSALYAGRARLLEKTITTKLFNKKTCTWYGGLDWKGKPVAQDSAHVYSFAILLDIMPQYHEKFTSEYLLPFVKSNRTGYTVAPSPFFMFYIFEALKKCGKAAESVDCIERWWGDFVKQGFSTTPEVWNGDADYISYCHAWSAHPIVHLSNIMLGIWQTAPAWKQITFAPAFTHADRVTGAVPTPLGLIESGWEKAGSQVHVYLKLPRGMQAKVMLPGVTVKDMTGKKEWEIKL